MYRSAGVFAILCLTAAGAVAGVAGRAPAMGSATGLSPIRPMVGSARGLSPIRPEVGSAFRPSPSRFRLAGSRRPGAASRFAHRQRFGGGGDLAYAGLALDGFAPGLVSGGAPDAPADASGGDAPVLLAPPTCVRPLFIHVGHGAKAEHARAARAHVRLVYGLPPCGTY